MGIPVLKEKRKFLMGAICIFIIIAIMNLFSSGKSAEGNQAAVMVKEIPGFAYGIRDLIKKQALSLCAPVFAFCVKDNVRDYDNYFEEVLFSGVPFLEYMCEEGAVELPIQDENTWAELVTKENMAMGDEESQDTPVAEAEVAEVEVEEAIPLDEAVMLENENARAVVEPVNVSQFVPHERMQIFNMEDYRDFTRLFQTFYAMDSNTMIGMEQLNVDALLAPDVTVDKTAEGPQILIYHTHSQEGFADSVPGDKSTTIVGAGDKLAKLLSEEYGYSVLHHTGEYDIGDRDSAYSRSLPALEQLLSENPGIQVIIDLHRDGVADGRKLAIDLDGRPTAQFMFFNGLSRTKSTGDIDYLHNPYQAENLALSFRMQLAVDEYYPGLARRIYLNGYRYNMHLRPSLLVELGAQTNTVEEIMNAVDPLAHVIDLVLSGKNPR